MPIKNQVLQVNYIAWDSANNINKTGDASNHILRLIRDGIESTPANLPSEVDSVNAPGIYTITLTPSEMNANSVTLAGKSLTANVNIIPVRMATA